MNFVEASCIVNFIYSSNFCVLFVVIFSYHPIKIFVDFLEINFTVIIVMVSIRADVIGM
jgi:hypothetical protein